MAGLGQDPQAEEPVKAASLDSDRRQETIGYWSLKFSIGYFGRAAQESNRK
ncbi:MAG: hypothetical protein L0387_21045 [Acidobacteria bacterium]|nr:hypothetical protein [Acidobacteriota bacterium]MCI0624104.1 hypothetical protein [Acidobacteriota bacterium]